MNKLNLQKSAVAFALLVAVGSVGFGQAYGYGGSSGTRTKVEICHNGNTIVVAKSAVKAHLSHGDTQGKCDSAFPQAPAPAATVAGVSTTPRVTVQQFSPVLAQITSLLSNIKTSNEAGNISDEDASKLNTQIASLIAAITALFK